LRGSVFGKEACVARIVAQAEARFHPLAGKCIWKGFKSEILSHVFSGFHPLAGKCIWKAKVSF